MRKRIIIWIFILLLLLFFHLISGPLHNRAEIWLKNKLITILPEGSSIGNIEWDILSSLKADSVVVRELGFISSVEVQYTLFGYLRRRIKSVILYDPKFNISFSHSSEVKERGIPSLFYIEELSVLNGYIEWEGHEFLLNGSGRLFSTENQIVFDIFNLVGTVDNIQFNLSDSRMNLEQSGSEIDIRELRVGYSNLRLFGRTDESIKGEGKINLRDLKTLWGVEGEGVVEVEFVYDSLFRFEGKSGPLSIAGYQLKPINFHGTPDSIWISAYPFRGYFKYDGKISCGFELSDLNMNEFNKDFPISKVNGMLNFTYFNRDSYSAKSTLSGSIMGSSLKDLRIKFDKLGERVIIEQLEGHVNNGKISFSGEYDRILKGNLFVEGVDISSLFKYFGINGKSIAYADISLKDKIYGVFSLDSIQYGPIEIGLVNGNIDFLQTERKFQGELSFVIQDVMLPKGKLFEVGEGVIRLGEQDIVLIGLFKREDKQMEYSFKYLQDCIEIEKLNITYPGGWLTLDSSFSISRDKGIKIEEVVLKGNKDEEVKLSLEIYESEIIGTIMLDEFNLRILQEFEITNLPISGNLGGVVTLAGKTNTPEINFDGNSKAKWKGESIGDSLKLNLSYFNKNLIINDITLFENNHYSRFNGEIDIINGSLDIKAGFDRGGRWVFYPIREYLDTRRLEVNGNIRVKGKLLTPLVYGEIKILKGNILLVKPGIRIEDLEAIVEFKGNEAILESARVYMSEGVIDAKGIYNIEKKSYNFKINVMKTPLNWQYVNAIIDGDINVSKKEEKIRIEGEIDLSRTIVTMPFRTTGNGGIRPKNLYLDIMIDASKGNVWVRNDMADMELLGEVGVQYDGGLLLLSGDLSVKQGNFYYLYRSFDVVKGEFNFRSSPELNPDVDIKAKTIIQDRDTVFLDVSGTMRTPIFELYSKPARSVADIITLLNLNLSWEDLSSLRAIEESITEAVFNYWVRHTFSRRFKEQFGIDLVEMRGESGHYEIVLGKYITDRLFIKARTDILSYEISEVHAEYRLRRWGSIVAENDFSGDTRLLFKLGWRY